ncbi:hypothetical protein EDD22DRAFT_845006 [Suillus occidentalis]|nr:hypothetical protein EDD22DRAFT_845006 [Suillus occidentalis]
MSSSLYKPTKKRKCGVHTGHKGHSLSSQRIQSQFGTEDMNDSDRQANSAWAQAVIACFGISTDLWPVNGAVLASHVAGEPSQAEATVPVGSHGDSKERFQRNLFNRVGEVEDKIDQVLRLHTSTSPSVPSETAPATLIPAAAPTAPLLDTVAHTVPREEIPTANLGIAHLRNEDFAYDKSQLQETSSSFVMSRSHLISSLCMTKTRPGTQSKLNGGTGRFTYQQILNWLTSCRMENAARDAADAHTFFGGNLDHPDGSGAFRYLKCGQTHILSKDDAIVKKWRELLNNDPAIASRFMQGTAGVTPQVSEVLPLPVPASIPTLDRGVWVWRQLDKVELAPLSETK